MNETMTAARKVLQSRQRELLDHANVVATGVGYKQVNGVITETPGIICSVSRKLPLAQLKASERVPASLDGVATDVIETGVIRALQAPTGRFRPAPGGVSVGHPDITAGTLGCWVRRNGQWMMLSNNHVLANSNDARRGDPILQPGAYDGGRMPGDQIATLEDFVPISFAGAGSDSDCRIALSLAQLGNGLAALLGSRTRLHAIRVQSLDNLVDAAIARPLQDTDVRPEILGFGALSGTASGELGMVVKKSGRTTGLTEGSILQVDVTVEVQFGAGRVARFTDQLMAGAMSQGGDSGSAVLDSHNRLIGLLFAGSAQTTIINRIEHVFEQLQLSL